MSNEQGWAPNNPQNQENPPVKPPVEEKKEFKKEIPTLVFPCHGWCKELETSYTMGVYVPKTKKEYEALKKYASKEF